MYAHRHPELHHTVGFHHALLIVVSGRSFSWSIGLASHIIIQRAAVMGMRAR